MPRQGFNTTVKKTDISTPLLTSKPSGNSTKFSNCGCIDGLFSFFQKAKQSSTSATQTPDSPKSIIGQSSEDLRESHDRSHARYMATRESSMNKLEEKKKRQAEEKEKREAEKKKRSWF